MPTLPETEISNLNFTELGELIEKCEALREEMRSRYVAGAEAMGLNLVPDNGKKRKRRGNANKQVE